VDVSSTRNPNPNPNPTVALKVKVLRSRKRGNVVVEACYFPLIKEYIARAVVRWLPHLDLVGCGVRTKAPSPSPRSLSLSDGWSRPPLQSHTYSKALDLA